MIDINEIQTDSGTFIAAIERCHPLSAKSVWSTYPQKPVAQIEFENLVSEAANAIAEDNPYENVVPGEISAIEAMKFKSGSYGLDIRPKVFDNKTKSWVLLDSGSCVSCEPKQPGDVIDPNFKLKSVNGGSIATFAHWPEKLTCVEK